MDTQMTHLNTGPVPGLDSFAFFNRRWENQKYMKAVSGWRGLPFLCKFENISKQETKCMKKEKKKCGGNVWLPVLGSECGGGGVGGEDVCSHPERCISYWWDISNIIDVWINNVWMWEVDHKEGWATKNWCFQTGAREDSWESLGRKGDQTSQS